MSSIEACKFYLSRKDLANGAHVGLASSDRTVALVRKWQQTSESLRAARAETLTCFVVSPAKSGKFELSLVDEDRFNTLQESIEAHNEELERLEKAVRDLDAIDAPMFLEINDQVGIHGRSEHVERQQIANMTSAYLQRRANTGKTPDEILAADPEFQRLKGLCEKRIEQSKSKLAELKPKRDQMKAILESVGC